MPVSYKPLLNGFPLNVFPTELPEGAPKQKINEMALKISKRWKIMSEDEKNNATKDALIELRERRENREVGEHKPGAAAAQDSFLTSERIQETVRVVYFVFIL